MGSIAFLVCLLIVLFDFKYYLKAIQLNFSHEIATAGQIFSIACIVENKNGIITFSKNDTSVCTITNFTSEKACILDGIYDTNLTYTCEGVIKIVKIPGEFVNHYHNTIWKCERSGYVFSFESELKTLCVKVPVTQVTILNGPNITNIVEVVEGANISLKCSTDPVRPSASFQWFISGDNIKSTTASSTDVCTAQRTISSSVFNYKAKRTDNGKAIYCSATNIPGTESVNSSFMRIDVQFRPLDITFSTTSSRFTVVEGESLGPINCTASCNPSCFFTWSGPGINRTTNKLQIKELTRSQSGNFTCTAYNVIGIFQKDIFIVVQYKAEVKLINSSTGNFIVSENSKIKLSCSADGEPRPNISWIDTDSLDYQKFLKGNEIGYSEIEVNATTCEQTDTYECTALNGILTPSTKQIQLNVTCRPRINVSCSSKSELVVNKNIATKIYACWIANPAPKVIWTLDHDANTTFKSSITKIGYNLYKSVLELNFSDVITVAFNAVATNTQGIGSSLSFKILVNETFLDTSSTLSSTRTSNRSYILYAIAIVVCLVFIIGVVVLGFWKYRNLKSKGKKEPTTIINDEDHSENDIPIYAVVKKPKKKEKIKNCNVNDPHNQQTSIYAEVDKPKTEKREDDIVCGPHTQDVPMYAEVHKLKSKFSSNFDDKLPLYNVSKETVKKDERESAKAPNDRPNKIESKFMDKSKRDLVYIEVEFDNKGEDKNVAIRGVAERTVYGVIDFSKKADPLPSDDEEENEPEKE